MRKAAVFIVLFLGVAGLFLEQLPEWHMSARLVTYIDFSLVFFLVAEFLVAFLEAPRKIFYLKNHIPSVLFLVVYLTFFIVSKLGTSFQSTSLFRGYFFLMVIRNLLLILKIFGRIRKLTGYLNSIFDKPAQTIVLSFVMVIVVGALLLMMPVMTVSGRINPVNAFFTATSAVCVTGLIVVDTPAYFTFAGQAVILLLIQIGGLGIMLLSYFMVFVLGRRVSLKERTLLSFMLNESDMKGIVGSVKRIIILTFSIEGGAALLLFPLFSAQGLKTGQAVWFSLFHTVSAFCNAGFALYSDSLESLKGNAGINFIIVILIICGGISFSVLTELAASVRDFLRKKRRPLSINSKVVLRVTAGLIVVPMLIIYKLEHLSLLIDLPLGEQYLTAFFQSVTLRTAGFNSLPFGSLQAGTLMLMIGVMFIGGASGSTAGGIKVNTTGVVWAYINSFRKGRENVLLFRQQIDKDQILQAFTVIIFGIVSVFSITLILMITEKAPPINLLFESVSAFATVGLSTGITGSLTIAGRLCIIILMFFGRIGPLTLLSASSRGEKRNPIAYPEARLLIG